MWKTKEEKWKNTHKPRYLEVTNSKCLNVFLKNVFLCIEIHRYSLTIYF